MTFPGLTPTEFARSSMKTAVVTSDEPLAVPTLSPLTANDWQRAWPRRSLHLVRGDTADMVADCGLIAQRACHPVQQQQGGQSGSTAKA
jgi:hypothetical protein